MEPKHQEKTSVNGINYLLYMPSDYNQSGKFPLILFLHGSGERGNNLELVKKNGPPKLIESGKEFPFIVVSPQCQDGKFWNASELMILVKELIKSTQVDEDRIYLTGISMGGYGIWALAISYPENFAAIIPICGGGDYHSVHKIKHVPTWVFHGAKDYIVPLEESVTMANALEHAGGKVELTVYPEAGHDSWTETYNNPEIYQWLLRQNRKANN